MFLGFFWMQPSPSSLCHPFGILWLPWGCCLCLLSYQWWRHSLPCLKCVPLTVSISFAKYSQKLLFDFLMQHWQSRKQTYSFHLFSLSFKQNWCMVNLQWKSNQFPWFQMQSNRINWQFLFDLTEIQLQVDQFLLLLVNACWLAKRVSRLLI